jgi:arylsulfatase A-like enzyme
VGDDLAIIVSADHGENLGELGIYAEHGTADYITCRIPMIVKWPGGRTGVNSGLHYNLDLPPTLAALLGKQPSDRWDGRSYAEAITDGADCGREHLILSQCAHVCQRSVRWDEWLYMRTWHDGYHLFPDRMLYNVAADPHEQNDLAGEHGDLCEHAEGVLVDWHERMMGESTTGIDPLQTVLSEGGPYHARGHLADYCKYLEETGRGWAVAELKKRHPREFRK